MWFRANRLYRGLCRCIHLLQMKNTQILRTLALTDRPNMVNFTNDHCLKPAYTNTIETLNLPLDAPQCVFNS